jgi:hypothetical protein
MERFAVGWKCLKRANKRRASAAQAQGFQGLQHQSLVSFHFQTEGLGTLGIPYQGFNFSA